MPEKPKAAKPKLAETSEEEIASGTNDKRSYYYDDAHGYQDYCAENKDEEPDADD